MSPYSGYVCKFQNLKLIDGDDGDDDVDNGDDDVDNDDVDGIYRIND